MKVLVLIVSYNFEPWLERCLGSLQQSQLPVEVLVIDNASQDCTVNRIREEYPTVRLIEAGENLGFGKANNVGMRIALNEGFDAVFLMNQDTWIQPDVLAKLAQYASCNPDYGILSPVHLTGKGDALDQGFATYAALNGVSQLPTQEQLVELTFLNAAFWWIPIQVVKEVGGFSPLFYHYGEDKDYINRLTYQGYKVGYLSSAFASHDREYRILTESAFFRSEYVYLLSELANVKYSALHAFAYGILAGIKKSMIALVKGGGRESIRFLSIVGTLFKQCSRAYALREQTRKRGAHFLN
ncbi:MAG: glycosyltransferase family 2 protein [Phocaeicola sp.]